jgi:hypothetical protein
LLWHSITCRKSSDFEATIPKITIGENWRGLPRK